MAPRRAKVNKFDSKNLSANDVVCPICRSILIKPITLPCSHGFCSSCFEVTTQNANLVCPLCRVRIGSWLRSATKSKKLVNESLWRAIQELFPLQIKNKLNGVNESFLGDKHKVKALNDNKTDVSRKIDEKIISNMREKEYQKLNTNKLRGNKIIDNKLTGHSSSVPSTSTNFVKTSSGLVNTISKSLNQIVATTSGKNENRSNFFLNNFATKEYTCRILCQNVSSKDCQKKMNESQILIQKKNKRIQKLSESEMSNDRSNSIESECLYFKPIDYRHNPPSEGLAPIKVPSRKPNVSANIKILAPCGQNQININSLESAFARLCSPALQETKVEISKKEHSSVASIKRKHDNLESKTKKKIRTLQNASQNQSLISKESINIELVNLCNTVQCREACSTDNLLVGNSNNNIKKIPSVKHTAKSLVIEDNIKKSLQEQADFELATKLQQTYNQSAKYSTRSTVLKRMAAKNQVKMDGLMTPYKVN